MSVRPSPSSRPTVAAPSWPARARPRRASLVAPRAAGAHRSATGVRRARGDRRPRRRRAAGAGSRDRDRRRDGVDPPHARHGGRSWTTARSTASSSSFCTFLGGVFYGAAGYFLLGLALWLGAKGVGVEAPFRIARQVVAFAAVPIALSAVVTVPMIVFRFGWDWFRTDRQRRRSGPGRRDRDRARVRRLVARPRRARRSGRRSGSLGAASSARSPSPV